MQYLGVTASVSGNTVTVTANKVLDSFFYSHSEGDEYGTGTWYYNDYVFYEDWMEGIPDSVTSIDGSAFDGCTGLESIVVEEGNPVYHSAGNCLIETQSKTLLLGCKNSIIPDDGSVTSIGGGAFGNCTGLKEIEIPNSVTVISEGAFQACTGLTKVVILDGVTSIGSAAFA